MQRVVNLRVIGAAALLAAALFTAPQSQAEPSAETEPSVKQQLPDGVTREELTTELAIDDFVEGVAEKFGSAVAPTIDRKSERIVLVGDDRSAKQMSDLDGRVVGGLAVEVRVGRFTPEVFDAALRRIGGASFANHAVVDSFSTTTNGDELVVNVRGLDGIGEKEQGRLQDDLTSLAGGAVRLREVQAYVNMSRSNDSDPWFGGGMIIHPGAPDEVCSTGFSVLAGSAGRMLSAGHCIRDGGSDSGTPHPTWDWRDGTGSDSFSTATAQYSAGGLLDSLLLDPVGGTAGQVHGGPWNATSSSTSRYHLSVNNADSNMIGQKVCTSGANSGEHCGLEIYDSRHVDCSLGICHRWLAYSPGGGVAIAPGDSGGPVYKQLANDDRVEARGIMKAGYDLRSCGSVRYSGGSCASTVLFIGINDILDFWNVQIETN